MFRPSEQPCPPLTTSEVADRLECRAATAKDLLEALTDQGYLQRRQIEGPARISWPMGNGETGQTIADDPSEQFRSFINAVEDYAIFTLGPEGNVASWNEGALLG